jgi:hypothetical protein
MSSKSIRPEALLVFLEDRREDVEERPGARLPSFIRSDLVSQSCRL